MGLGWVIDGSKNHEYISADRDNSNNVAEYSALIRLLEAMPLGKPRDLRITGDSQLVVAQLNGEFGVRSEMLRPLYSRVSELFESMRSAGWTISLEWVEREGNALADEASKEALAEQGVGAAERKPNLGFTSRLADIGEPRDVSAVMVGKTLTESGLRGPDRKPAERAYAEGFAQERFDGYSMVVDWNEAKVGEIIDAQISLGRLKRKPKLNPVLADHLCGHTATLGLRPSCKQVKEVSLSLCDRCLRGNKRDFEQKRKSVLQRCSEGASLLKAVKATTSAKHLRPSVYLAVWGRWRHEQMQQVLAKYCPLERPEQQPAVLKAVQRLANQKEKEIAQLMQAALRSRSGTDTSGVNTSQIRKRACLQ
jgi:ribonuclease HI